MGAQGTANLDFGVFPGKSDASVAVTGQTGIVAGSLVEAWMRLEATADHSVDEALVEEVDIQAGNIVAGTGFTIYGVHKPALGDTMIYGLWKIGWVWN